MSETSIEKAKDALRKTYGANCIQPLTGYKSIKWPVIPTGSYNLDKALHIGGWPQKRIVEIYGDEGSGKCVKFDQKVINPLTGELIEIRLCNELNEILSMNNDFLLENRTMEKWVSNGIQECLKVTTKTGRCIEVTEKHPFYTIEGWKGLGYLKIGDRIAVPREIPIFGKEIWSEEKARLLGYLIADGGLTGATPIWTKKNEILVKDFSTCLAKEFPQISMKSVSKKNIGYRLSQINSLDTNSKYPKLLNGRSYNLLTKWLDDLNLLGKLSKEKEIPKDVFKLNKSCLSEFLKAFISSEGYYCQKKGGGCIEISSASKILIKQIQHLLLRFGIISSLKYHKAKCKNKYFDSWRLLLTEYYNIRKFFDKIGWIGKNYILPSIPKKSIYYMDTISRELVLSYCGNNQKKIARDLDYCNNINVNTTRKRLKTYIEKNKEKYSGLKKLTENDILWDTIEKIEYIGKHPVYDLVVPTTHNFVAEDFIVHNSTMALSACVQAQKMGLVAVYVDMEQTVSLDYSKNLGLDFSEDKFLISQPECGEEALDIVSKMIECDEVGIIVVDSVASLITRKELECDTDETSSQMGAVPRFLGFMLRQLNTKVNRSNAVLMFINQTRPTIGVQSYIPLEHTPGGRALKFYSTIRVSLRNSTAIKDGDEEIGKRVNITVAKHKLAPPKVKTWLEIRYGEGIDTVVELFEWGVESGVINKEGQSYSFDSTNLGRGKESAVNALREFDKLDMIAKLMTKEINT